MIDINPICKTVYRINLYFLFIFILCKEKKLKPGLYLQQADNTLALNPQQIDKKAPFDKMNCLIHFFIGKAIKIAVLVSWCTTSVSYR